MTLKIYTKQDDIPEGLRAEYKQQGSQWVPDLSDDHPALVFNKTLKQEKEVEEAKVKKLRSDLDDALEAGKTSGVPRGQALVAKVDAEAIDKYKALGTVDELTAVKTEHASLKDEVAKQQRKTLHTTVAKELGYNPDAFVALPDLPDFEVREKDGKKTVVAKVKEGENVVEKDAKGLVESSYAALLPALQAKPGVKVVADAGSGGDNAGADPDKWATDFAKNYVAQSQPVGDVYAEFNKRSSV